MFLKKKKNEKEVKKKDTILEDEIKREQGIISTTDDLEVYKAHSKQLIELLKVKNQTEVKETINEDKKRDSNIKIIGIAAPLAIYSAWLVVGSIIETREPLTSNVFKEIRHKMRF